MDAVFVDAPPSKSVSHRKVIAAALADGVSHLSRVLESDDISRTMDVLTTAGATFERTGPGAYTARGVNGMPLGGVKEPVSCFMGESGTSARLLLAVLAAGTGAFRVHGAGRLHERPMAELTDALRALGTEVAFEKQPGLLPLRLNAHGLQQTGEWLPITLEVSSQFLSGLLLAAPLAKNGLSIVLAGEKAVSWPYVGLTLQVMEDSGRAVTVETLENGAWKPADWKCLDKAEPGATRFKVPHGGYGPLKGLSGEVEGDYSGASYLLAAGALGGRPVTVRGLRRDSIQGDAAMPAILEAMGATVRWNGNEVTVNPAPLRGIARDMGGCPDIVPTVAVLASRATGPTELRNVAHLRAKESDRLEAIALELAKTGCDVTVADDAIRIVPGRPLVTENRVDFSTHDDHRMAMSLALLELTGLHIHMDNRACVSKSFPAFWETWRTIFPQTRIPEAS